MIEEPWRQEGFRELPRSQQTVQIFKVVENMIKTMKEGVSSSERQVEGIRRRMERLETLVELIDETPDMETIPSQTSSKAGEADGGGEWFYTLDKEEAGSHPHSQTILQHRRSNPKVTLNVGGHRHEVMWKQLEKKPLTRLGKLSRAKTHRDILALTDGYSLSSNEIYFDRDPATFNGILNFYRLHLLDEICVLDYQDDLEFWMIKELNLEICCIDKFTARRDAIVEEIAKEKAFAANDDEVDEFEKGYFTRYQRCLWDLMEKPQSSVPAKVLSLISITLVLISLVAMCLNTFTWLQSKDVNGNPVDNPKLALIEAICISYFTVEFLLRLAGAPKKLSFLKNTMNIVDCAAILPYYITLFFMPADDFSPPSGPTTADPGIMPANSTMTSAEEEEGLFDNFSRIMQVFRIARIMRIFKLARRSVGLQAMAHTVRTSWKDLGLLFMLVGMGMLVFGSLLYYIENDPDTKTGFVSIPAGMWWAVQTLTSLGYGDYWPESVLGKVMGSACAVCGVLVMALPIPIVVDNFANYYSEQKRLEAQELKREEFDKEMEFRAEMRETEEKELLRTVARKIASGENNQKPKQTQVSFS